ncbi:MAG: GtrA family protein [Sinobacteraceae bacterium]|nr:GtrA family protein [Nevskiaceae bacterium]
MAIAPLISIARGLPLKMPLSNAFIRFAAVGVIGFLVDAGVLTLLSRGWGMNLYLARCFSFGTASLVTFLLNRRFTFTGARQQSAVKEYLRYMTVQSVGSLTNLAVFMVMVGLFPQFATTPVIPLAFGSAAGLIVNFAGSRFWVFR